MLGFYIALYTTSNTIIRKLPYMPEPSGGATGQYLKQLPIYTWVECSNNSKVPYTRTQHVGHSGARTHKRFVSSATN